MEVSLAHHLDLADHRPNSTGADIQGLCEKVLKYGFNSAFVNPHYVSFARKILGDKGKVGTVVSFPLGQDTLAIKVAAARSAILSGADELDISLNVGYLKEHAWSSSLSEMKEIVLAVRAIEPAKVIKFIPETGCLTTDEIKKSAELILESGADFYKTCSGMGPRGVAIEDVKIVRSVVGDKIKIKVAGGVTTYEQAIAFIEAGADRIGTSHAVEIINNTDKSETRNSKFEVDVVVE